VARSSVGRYRLHLGLRGLWVVAEALHSGCEQESRKNLGQTSLLPFGIPPPNPVILLSLAEPPARILASRRSLRMRACSAALDGGELAALLGGEEMTGVSGVSAIFDISQRHAESGLRSSNSLQVL
jgi:hypothetical protein